MDYIPKYHQIMQEIFATRDRENMHPTIAALLEILSEHPEDPLVLYEVGGAYDTAGNEEQAAIYYERALNLGLEGDVLCRCYLQYGSTLRNLGHIEESLKIFSQARAGFPESIALKVFEIITYHAQGKLNKALGEAFTVIIDNIDNAELKRYETAIRGNAAYIAELDK